MIFVINVCVCLKRSSYYCLREVAHAEHAKGDMIASGRAVQLPQANRIDFASSRYIQPSIDIVRISITLTSQQSLHSPWSTIL